MRLQRRHKNLQLHYHRLASLPRIAVTRTLTTSTVYQFHLCTRGFVAELTDVQKGCHSDVQPLCNILFGPAT